MNLDTSSKTDLSIQHVQIAKQKNKYMTQERKQMMSDGLFPEYRQSKTEVGHHSQSISHYQPLITIIIQFLMNQPCLSFPITIN